MRWFACHFTVKDNFIDCVTSFLPLVAPVGDAVAFTVIVEVPLGVEKVAAPPHAERPENDPANTMTAAPCISRRCLALRLLDTPKRISPSRRPLHQKIPVGVTRGA